MRGKGKVERARTVLESIAADLERTVSDLGTFYPVRRLYV